MSVIESHAFLKTLGTAVSTHGSDQAIQMSKGGTLSFKSVKSADGFFARKRNATIRLQLYTALKSLDGAEKYAANLADELGIASNKKGREIASKKALTSRQVSEIVNRHFARIDLDSRKNELCNIYNGITWTTSGGDGGVLERLKKLAGGQAGVKVSTPSGGKFMEAAAKRFLVEAKRDRGGGLSRIGTDEEKDVLLNRFAEICQEAHNLLDWHEAKRNAVVLKAIQRVEGKKSGTGGLSLGAADTLGQLLVNAVDEERDNMLKAFALGETVDRTAVDRRIDGIMSVFDGVSEKSVPFDVLSSAFDKSLAAEKDAIVDLLGVLVKDHPELADKVDDAFGSDGSKCFDALRTQVLKPFVDKIDSRKDFVEAVKDVEKHCQHLTKQMKTALENLNKILKDERDCLKFDDDCLKTMKRTIGDAGTEVTNEDLARFAMGSDSQRDFLGNVLKSLVRYSRHLENAGDPIEDILVSPEVEKLNFAPHKSLGKSLAEHITQRVAKELVVEHDDLHRAAQADWTTMRAFNLPDSVNAEVRRLADEAKGVLERSWSKQLSLFLKDPESAKANWKDLQKRALEDVRTFLRDKKFDDLYLENQREIKIQSAEAGKNRYMKELRTLIFGDDETKGVDQSRLPEAMRITPEMIGAKVLAEYQQVLDDPLGLRAPIISDPKVDAEHGRVHAVAATDYLSHVTELIAFALKSENLTGIVDPDTLALREANFAPTDDKRAELEKVLKNIRDQVVADASHLDYGNCEKLRDEVVECVKKLKDDALRYRAQDTVVEMFASKQALLVYKLSSAGCFGGEQQKAILDYLHALCKEYPEKSLVELEGLIQRKVMSASTRVNDCSAQAVKTLASSSIVPDVKNERVLALLDRVFVSCLTEASDKAPDVDEIVAAMRERYDASENELEKVLKTNPCKGWHFPSDGAGSWLTGYPAEKVAALKALFARSELNRRKHEFGSSLDPADILRAAEGKFANAVEDIKWIINDIRGKANAEAIGQRGFLSSLKLHALGYSKEISEKFEAKIQEALNAYANNPEAYRNQHFIEAMVK